MCGLVDIDISRAIAGSDRRWGCGWTPAEVGAVAGRAVEQRHGIVIEVRDVDRVIRLVGEYPDWRHPNGHGCRRLIAPRRHESVTGGTVHYRDRVINVVRHVERVGGLVDRDDGGFVPDRQGGPGALTA